jgi:hypothetical protein
MSGWKVICHSEISKTLKPINMKIFLTESEVIELAYDALDMHCPDPDKVHDIAKRMDMVYDEYLDMFEDVEEVSMRKIKRQLKSLVKV